MEIDAMRKLSAICQVCEGPLRTDNRYGICNKTLECRRKKALVKYYRYQENQRSRALEYSKENRDEINRKGRERFAAQRHDEITYIIWSPGLRLVKIGRTTGLKMRFKAIRNGCPDAILIGTLPCGRELEKYLHAMFASKIAGGEWFNLGPDPIRASLDILEEVLKFAEDRINGRSSWQAG